jgi:hypothetical protein
LPNALRDLYEKAVERSGIQVNRPEIDKLLAASEFAGAQAGSSTREANAVKKSVAESGSGLAPPPTEAEMAEAFASVQAGRTALEAAVSGYQVQTQHEDLAGRLVGLELQRDGANARQGQTQAQLRYIEEEVAKLPSVEAARMAVPQMDAGLKATIDSILWHAGGLGLPGAEVLSCGVCGAQQSAGHFEQRAATARAELERHAEATKTATASLDWVIKAHQKADELLAGARFDNGQAASAVAEYVTMITQIKELLAKVPEPQEALTIENARGALAAAEARLSQLAQANAAWESTRKMRDGAVTAESEASRWKQLADACGEVIRDLLDAGVLAFNARVQALLPPGDKFGLRLRDGGREVCQFGLYRGESLYTALSGAEWARVTAALASVCGPTAEDRLAVVCPEERAFDPDTLTAVMAALGSMPQQVIMESPVRPTVVPQGWSVVDTGAERKPPPRVAEPPAAVVNQPPPMAVPLHPGMR